MAEDQTQIIKAVGELTGMTRTMHDSLITRMNDIKDEMRRMEHNQKERLSQVENNLSDKINSLEVNMKEAVDKAEKRITALEEEDKRIIEKVARVSFAGGGVGGALATAAVELIKRLS